MILRYPGQTPDFSAEIHSHDSVSYISKDEWLELVNFRIHEISAMKVDEIQRRISALKSIEDAPHYSFDLSLKDDPQFMEIVKETYETTLNGSAGHRISILEDFLAGKGIPKSRLK